MGYRIEYAAREGTLRAVVSGRSSLHYAKRIARDIAQQARVQAARQVLIDVRRLVDRVGTLGALVLPVTGVAKCPVAVLDVRENDAYYAFPEHTARASGRALQLFYDPSDAARWLEGKQRGK